jgi:hypothetical protein
MTIRNRTRWIVAVAVCLLVAFAGIAVALDLGDIVKVAGIGYLVSEFGPQIDKTINKALAERQAEAKGATKVVPILTVLTGGYVGAAQVVGVPDRVKKVQAVAQTEPTIGDVRVTVLIPVSTKTPHRAIQRVTGVGVSAVIDLKIK